VQFAAFFRNTNLGRAGSPTKAQLERAFLESGSTLASNFQANGTLVFEAKSLVSAQKVLALACSSLAVSASLREPACVRPLNALSRLPWQEVFAGIGPTSVHELTVSFACREFKQSIALPVSSDRKDATILWLEGLTALSITRKVMSGPGSPNMLLERLTGIPFTSRSLGTIQRLLSRHA
jgi:hypothetical protein